MQRQKHGANQKKGKTADTESESQKDKISLHTAKSRTQGEHAKEQTHNPTLL